MDNRNDLMEIDEKSIDKIKVNVDVVDLSDALMNLGVDVLLTLDEDTCLTLSFEFSYDPNNETHKKIKNYIYLEGLYNTGIFSDLSRTEKFIIKNQDDYSNVSVYQKSENVFGVRFALPSSDTDHLLRLLSIGNDAISTLKEHGVVFDFTVVDILNKLANGHKNKDIENAFTTKIKQLINFISTYPDISHEDAILLFYSFNAIESHDCLATLDLKKLTLLEMISSTIDHIFSFKFLKPQNSVLKDEEYQNSKDPQRRSEVNEFLKRINLWQRIKLYSPCLGKLADDGGLYQWHYTEWYALRHNKFRLDEKGDVYIDLKKENPKESGYLTCYAVNMPNHDIYDRELLALGKYTHLSFPDNVKWHEKITFMPECSQYLFNLKLHLDLDPVKVMINARNKHRFFKQISKSGFFIDNFPEEVVRLIYTLAVSPVPVISLEEFTSPQMHYTLEAINIITALDNKERPSGFKM